MRDLLGTGWRLLTRPTGPPSRPTRRNLLFDAALAVALGIAMIQYARVDLADGDFTAVMGSQSGDLHVPAGGPISSGGLAVLIAGAVIAAAALALRRRFPLAVLWVVIASTLVASADEPRLTFYACVVAAYSAAAYSPYRVPALVGVGVAVLTFSVVVDYGFPVVPAEYIPLIALVPIAVAADGLRRWKIRADERRTELAELEHRQAEALRRAAEEERARIARELHDIVTHNVGVMIIQAGAARKVMQTSPEQATEALLAVESGGRAAMGELRQAMGLLTMNGDRSDDADDSPELEPSPGMAALPALVSRVREAGLDVDITVTGEERPLPPGIELAAYRVVQEALTNTVKHAAGAAATVTVDYGDHELRIEVVDSGGEPVGSAAGSGRGLVGLRERLALYGGTVDAAHRPTGGYRVMASIPLEEP